MYVCARCRWEYTGGGIDRRGLDRWREVTQACGDTAGGI